MSLTLQFSIVTLNPSTYRCEIFHGPPYTDRELRGHIDPLQTVPLTPVNAAHTATFTANPGNGYALRLLNASGKVFARSNARTLASKQRLLVIEGTDRIAEATFGTFAPPVPFTEEKTTFDRLDLDFQGNDLRLFGHALHDGVFNKRFNLDYRFRVAPVDIPVWTPVTSLPADETPEDTLTIDTTSLTIDTDRFYDVLLRQHGTYVGPGHWFGEEPRVFRLGFGLLAAPQLAAALEGVSAALRSSARTGLSG